MRFCYLVTCTYLRIRNITGNTITSLSSSFVSSNLRLKINIKLLNNSIDKLLKLNPVSYKKKRTLEDNE